MELRHLKYFEAVANTGNLTHAAAALRISQPSLSQAMKELEADVGQALLMRGPRGSMLTDAGRELARHAADILSRIPQAREATRRAARGTDGQLIVGFTGSSVFDIVPTLVRHASRVLPQLSLRLEEMLTDRQIESLHARRIDVGIGRPLDSQPGLSSLVLAERSFMLAVHANHRLAQRREIALADLEGEPLITPQRRAGPGFNAQLMAMLSKAKLNLQVAHEVMHMPIVPGLVAAGLGVGIVSDELRNLEVRDVLYRPLAEGRGAVCLAMSWRQDNESQLLHHFVRACGQAVGTDAAGHDAAPPHLPGAMHA